MRALVFADIDIMCLYYALECGSMNRSEVEIAEILCNASCRWNALLQGASKPSAGRPEPEWQAYGKRYLKEGIEGAIFIRGLHDALQELMRQPPSVFSYLTRHIWPTDSWRIVRETLADFGVHLHETVFASFGAETAFHVINDLLQYCGWSIIHEEDGKCAIVDAIEDSQSSVVADLIGRHWTRK